ncbi:hypothetical protein KL86DPRO_10123 [uncultured delta proteobacterium]|uniref:Uncharacterized protein n=1 Tax=uncultured delta proteobacterium TaxID=34034 RepID=A0A212IV26_9DELT|nr:hypothetical protein KL86DPRO_10123 [uncultured delta proteobacterium]
MKNTEPDYLMEAIYSRFIRSQALFAECAENSPHGPPTRHSPETALAASGLCLQQYDASSCARDYNSFTISFSSA